MSQFLCVVRCIPVLMCHISSDSSSVNSFLIPNSFPETTKMSIHTTLLWCRYVSFHLGQITEDGSQITHAFSLMVSSAVQSLAIYTQCLSVWFPGSSLMLYLISHFKCDKSALIILNYALKIHLKGRESAHYIPKGAWRETSGGRR